MMNVCVNSLYQTSESDADGKTYRHLSHDRFTPGHGYLEALVADNADVVTEEIIEIKENGLLTKDGKFHEVDAIVCATGFNTSFVPNFDLIGIGYPVFTDNRSLRDESPRCLEKVT